MLTITDLAREKIQEILKENPGQSLRIIAQGGGCCGPQFGLALDELKPADAQVMSNGINVLLSPEVNSFADKATIDYIVEPEAEGFTIDIAGSSCGDSCGGGCH